MGCISKCESVWKFPVKVGFVDSYVVTCQKSVNYIHFVWSLRKPVLSSALNLGFKFTKIYKQYNHFDQVLSSSRYIFLLMTFPKIHISIMPGKLHIGNYDVYPVFLKLIKWPKVKLVSPQNSQIFKQFTFFALWIFGDIYFSGISF